MCYFISLHPQKPPSTIPLLIPLDDTPMGISYDPTERRIYWSDAYGYIHRAFLNGSSTQVIIRGLWRPMGIEIDIVGRKIYFADEYENNIRVATLDGNYQALLLTVESPQGIALDSLSG